MMGIESEIRDVLKRKCFISWGNWTEDFQDQLVSDLARLMERGEPSRDDLLVLMSRRLDKWRASDADAIMAWASSGGTRKHDVDCHKSKCEGQTPNSGHSPCQCTCKFIGTRKRVTREHIRDEVSKYLTAITFYPSDMKKETGYDKKAIEPWLDTFTDKIMRLLDPEPSKRWCEHITENMKVRFSRFTCSGDMWNQEAVTTEIKFCPICGSPRPVEAK